MSIRNNTKKNWYDTQRCKYKGKSIRGVLKNDKSVEKEKYMKYIDTYTMKYNTIF